MNIIKNAILALSVLAVTLIPSAPVFAASEQGLAHGKGKGLVQTETVTQTPVEEEAASVAQTSATLKPAVAHKSTKAAPKKTVASTQTVAPKGNNGTLKIHEKGTPNGTENNDPKVCSFNVEGFGLDANQTGYLQFTVQGGDKPTGKDAGPYSFGPTNANGFYASQYFLLKDGHYKATLYGKMLPGGQLTDVKAKSKVFKVRCGEVLGDKTCPTGTTWNDKNSNKKVDTGECLTSTTTTTTTPTDENGQVLGTSTKLAYTGYEARIVSIIAVSAGLAAIALALQTKKRPAVDYDLIAL
jgi:hypothetical protein